MKPAFFLMVCKNNLERQEEETQPRQPSCKRYFSSKKEREHGKHLRRDPPQFSEKLRKEELLSDLQVSLTVTLQKGHVSIHDL